MKTLVLLSTLVLLAFQALADPLPEATGEAKNEQQPGLENQDVTVFFEGPEGSALQRPGKGGGVLQCSCRRFCPFPGRSAGFCGHGPNPPKFCCR
ncbi:defensin alpha-like protein 1 [Mesocricetus auratus]|uniref:Defensin alpha-like protein 1 n=1 Tax=Mesocricetus auratus TaxID=10036 RepID=A0ABM2X2V2_MESAU|nr:defensin alpha-like protein 1 [Mesocricetus auratus]XP_040589481.1 defensin alpha-like protein 1 [Mesocricetus auratus]XP_040597216.1 defensin alpha-like protein 1 [Mesocricetus auratus]XP_040597217.1 defensin alpha-like protein 1 [Mesocricetus auratus]XP_040597218.1 defensin alpha-like protein 1 [Mesocricetus auratus]